MTRVAGLDCKLPVALNEPGADQYIGMPHGGFVSFPTAALTEDPTSELQYFGSGPEVTTVTRPSLAGQWPGPAFDWQLNRWVPARSPQVVSPDGSAYVYAAEENWGTGPISPTQIRVVTVSTGANRLLYRSGATDLPIAWTKDGIYIVASYYEATANDLRLLDPRTGAARVITSSGTWTFISGGAAWGFTPTEGLISGFTPHTVSRLDLATGKVTTWYRVLAPRVAQVLGVDLAGRPIIAVGKVDIRGLPVTAYRVFRLVAPFASELLFTAWPPIDYGFRLQIDTHGIWLTYSDIRGEIWLYADGVGLVKVAETGKDILDIAGPCR